ncbi:Kin of IRRE-like protein 1 [Portunus trituberculatus]|uniref:Kin of IRRE-like protein 1 n=1 Tax=Portunus trituberculatus TaxID=210409 RepID=A0A5B7KIG1_PORTR|nr:Kin of IRRE-like protein 1 [Portunus trituberculatus]
MSFFLSPLPAKPLEPLRPLSDLESRSMRVYMRGAPVVVEAAEQFGMEGDDVKVECMVEGMPRPDRVEWAKGRRPLNTSKWN